MKSHHLPLLLGLSLLPLSAQTLERVAAPAVDAAQVEAWKNKLIDPDLDRREQAFRELTAKLRHDAELRGAAETWAKDSAQVELAWTARLALRSAQDPLAGFWNFSPQAFGQQFDPQVWGFDPQSLFAPGWSFAVPGQSAPAQPAPPSAQAPSTSESHSLSLQSGPDGVKVTIERDENGQKKSEEYSAASIEELLEAHPELADELGQGAAAPDSFGWPNGMFFGRQGRGMQPFGRFQDPFSASPRGSFRFEPQASTEVRRTDVLGVLIRQLDGNPDDPSAGGLWVERVEPNTIAAALGLQRGHILKSINGQRIHAASDISAVLAARQTDQSLSVEFQDLFGQIRERTWNPQAHPQPTQKPTASTNLRKI